MNRDNLDFFQISGQQDDLIEFLKNTIKGFKSDLSHILIILMKISWPQALFMFRALIN